MRMTLVVAGRICRLGAMVLVGMQLSPSALAAPLDAGVQRRVREATFEVVIPKPAKESVIYDKAWHDLIPFQLRSDKYVPIGTAFSVGGGRYVTAMHVMFAAVGDSRGEPMLRDASGNTYPLGQIVKGSADQDFVVFTLAKAPEQPATLGFNEKPELNETVYAVGNALGEGIVVREGNYISDTPEEENGRWKWLRFSAPISGGNSGGPLVDGKGNVLGIIRARRTTENTLNLAVPIDLVTKAPDNVATADTRVVTGFPVFDKTRAERFKAEIPLPKTFAEFSAAYIKASIDFDAAQLHALFADTASETFPRGAGSERLLHGLYERSAPGLVVKGGNGNWAISQLSYSRLDLGHDGWQDAANFKGISIYHRHKPADVDASRWYTDPQLAKDLVLRSSPSTLHIGGENAKVVSLGRPEEAAPFTDIWGRVWQVRVWHMTGWFMSQWLAEFDLAVPDGTVGFESVLSTFGRSGQLERMKLLTGFFAASYEGKLSEWDEFLAQKSLLPRQLSRSMLRFDYGHSIAFDDRRVSFAYGTELQKIERDSRLRLDFGFIPDGDGALLDIAGVVTANADDKTETAVFRHGAPGPGANETARKEWTKRLAHSHPYDAVATPVNGKQSIVGIYGDPGAQPAPEVLYTFHYRADSGVPQDVMKAKLDALMHDAKVNEH